MSFASCSSSFHSYSESFSNSSSQSTSSSMSTPSKRGATGVGDPTRRNLCPELQADLRDRVQDGVSVEHFVEHVWGVSLTQMAVILKAKWQLDPEAFSEYSETIRLGHHENGLYVPFVAIVTRLAADTRLHLGIDSPSPVEFIPLGQRDYVIKNEYCSRKPDLVSKWLESSVTWELIQAVIEFKKKNRRRTKAESNSSLSVASGSQPSGSISAVPERVRTQHSSTTSRSTSSRSRRSMDPLPHMPSHSMTRRSQDSKRSIDTRLGTEHSTQFTGQVPVRDDAMSVSPTSISLCQQSERNLLPSVKAPGRSQVTEVTPKLQYCRSSTPSTEAGTSTKNELSPDINNRMALPAFTETTSQSSRTSTKRKHTGNHTETSGKRSRMPPNLTADQLQLATYALECLAATSRYYVTGIFIDKFDVSLWYFDRMGAIRTTGFKFNVTPQVLALVVFALSNCDPVHAGFDPNIIPPASSEPSRSGEAESLRLERPLTTMCGAHLILPSITSSPSGETIQEVRYLIEGNPLYAYRGLVGRGTMVYPVKDIGTPEPLAPNLVVKLSWPVAHRPREDHIITKLRRDVPEMRDHLPDLKFSAMYSPDDKIVSLPRLRIPSLPSSPIVEGRVFTVLVTSRYEKLWEVDTLDNFQKIFIDFVECHHFAYERGRVLHRDLSQNNLMFSRTEGGDVRGILNDWDLSSEVDDKGEVTTSTTNHRTGTVPYMARELLDDNPPPHLYRHDLESLFYVLVWAAIHYDLKEKKKLPTVDELKNWDAATFDSAKQAKDSFFYVNEAVKVFRLVRGEFEAIKSAWIFPLWQLFRDAFWSVPLEDTDGYDWRTFDGRLTFDKFMATIKQEPRTFPPHCVT